MSDDKKEREFIHAIASPLAGIEMILDSVLEDLNDTPPDPMGYGERIREVMIGVEKMKVLLKERREEVLSGK